MAEFWVGFRYPNENINANYLPSGFDEVGFDDSSWETSKPQQAITNLAGYPASNLEQINMQPISVKKTGKGAFILDYGVTVDGLPLSLAKDVGYLGKEADYIKVIVGSGNYQFNTISK